ncbi:MAG TPA: zf-HC2 domain-containing protein [Dehalococcoidia bacterium]|nr:zf-HC2 domain-containing protein [Dehalococcoidia bacterium]
MKLPFGHQRLRDQLSAYLDGELNVRQSVRLDAHLETCEACRGLLEELHLTRDTLGRLTAVPAPRSFALTPQQAAGAPAPRLKALPLAWGLATAVSAFVLAFALVGDLASNDTSVPANQPTAAQESAGAPPTSALRANANAQASGQPFDNQAPPAEPAPGEAQTSPESDNNGWRVAEIAGAASLGTLLLLGGGYTLRRRRSI